MTQEGPGMNNYPNRKIINEWSFRSLNNPSKTAKTHQMKRNVLYNLCLLPLAMLIATLSMSQTGLVQDQNPNYLISEAKYTKIADSLNSLHGTTPQETYKAIDWLADRREAREQRRAFRRELRLERARYGWYYNDYSNYYPGYSDNYNYYYHPYHNYRYGYGWNRNSYWNLVPLAATVGWLLTR